LKINFVLIILLICSIGFSLYLGASSWQAHQHRQQATAVRGWRYRSNPLKLMFQGGYIIAGTVSSGAIWEMRRIKDKGFLFFYWATTDARLPYGLLRILPRRASVTQHTHPELRLVIWHTDRWQHPALADYIILTSHQHLGELSLSPEVALALSHWPEWPLPGSLEEINWSHDGLTIQVRYFDDWTTADRLVGLGATLVSNLQAHRTPLTQKIDL
jgi:hypothetical protein